MNGASRKTKAEAGEAAPTEVRQQISVLNKELEEAASKFERLERALATQEQLEQLLRQGRSHLQDLRSRLQQMTAERDRLQTELSGHVTAHRLEVEGLQKQIQEHARQLALTTTERDRVAARLDEREKEILSKEQEHRTQVETATAKRDRLETQLQELEAAHKQFAVERTDERFTFERLLAEARSNQRDLVQELDEQGQQNKILREAAMRAQALARKIMQANEPVAPASDRE